MGTYTVWVYRQNGENVWWNNYPTRKAARDAFETLKKFYSVDAGWASIDLQGPNMEEIDSYDNGRFEPANF